MAQGWHCPGGHSGDGSLPLPACPICGLPIAMVYLPDPPAEPAPVEKELAPAQLSAAPEPELTLAGPAGAALSMTDLAFLHAEDPPEALEDTDWLPIPMPFSGATLFPVGESMLPPEPPPAATVEAAPPGI